VMFSLIWGGDCWRVRFIRVFRVWVFGFLILFSRFCSIQVRYLGAWVIRGCSICGWLLLMVCIRWSWMMGAPVWIRSFRISRLLFFRAWVMCVLWGWAPCDIRYSVIWRRFWFMVGGMGSCFRVIRACWIISCFVRFFEASMCCACDSNSGGVGWS